VGKRSVEVRWRGEGMLFDGVTSNGSVAVAAGSDECQGMGPTPMQLLLVAVGACTGMDVVSVLKKMRQPVESLRIEVIGEKPERPPDPFTAIEVVYHLKGDLDEAKVRRAIELSENKYCSVQATLRGSVSLTSRYVIEA
jgi:putative redox protein